MASDIVDVLTEKLQDEQYWPYFVLICDPRNCAQVGIMRWRRLWEAVENSQVLSEATAYTYIVYGKKGEHSRFNGGVKVAAPVTCRKPEVQESA